MKIKAKQKTWFYAYLFIAPTLIGVLILNLYPLFQSVFFSFTKYKGLSAPVFIGLKNYSRLFSDSEVKRSILNTLIYTLLTVPIGVLLSLIAAELLNAKIKGKGLFRCLYFLPVVSTPAAVALVWKWLFNKQYGIINFLLSLISVNPLDWLGSGNLPIIALAIIGIWSMIGYNMIILIAGLQEIPQTLYEVAELDGASVIAKFKNVTLPMVSPSLFFVSITSFISALQLFDIVYMIFDPLSPAFQHVESIVYLFYRYTFLNYNKGYGSSIVVVLFVIILFITLLQMKLQKKWVYYAGE